MKVHYDINGLPDFHKAVITIGSYDGVHKGHQKILAKLNKLSSEIKGESVVITFHPHPRKIIKKDNHKLWLLNTLEEKIEQCKANDIDHLVIVEFNESFANQSPQEYIEHFLVGKFHPAYIVIGYDHKFGKNRGGNIDLLREFEDCHQFKSIVIDKEDIENIAISSTKIRNALQIGDVATANDYLGYQYTLAGKVIKGLKIGRTIDYPTANIGHVDEDKLIPTDGIYAVKVMVNSIEHNGMLYIGNRPTIDEKGKVIEVHIFDFDNDIYDQDIQIKFVDFIRADQKFQSLDELKQQLDQDKISALKILNTNEALASPIVSIAVLNWNGEQLLESFLPSVTYSSHSDFDLVVIDNDSSDGSIAYLEDWHPEANIIQTGSNLGFAGGYNHGIKNIQTKYVALVNSDVMATEGWIDPIIELMEADPTIGAAQPKILSLEEKDRYEYAGASGGFMDRLGYPYCRGRIFNNIEEDHGQYDDAISIDWASGAALVIRTELYNSIGGLDEDYFAHMEEIDLCIRIQRAGYQCKAVPQSVVYHLGGGTLAYNSPKKIFLNFRNSLMTLIKNDDPSELIWKIPLRLVLDGVAGIKLLMEGNLQGTLAIVKSHFSLYKRSIATCRSRKRYNKKIKSVRIGENRYKPRLKSIVYSFFILGRKKYSDL